MVRNTDIKTLNDIIEGNVPGDTDITSGGFFVEFGGYADGADPGQPDNTKKGETNVLVAPMDAEAVINGVKYAPLADALDTAQAGDTVEIVKDTVTAVTGGTMKKSVQLKSKDGTWFSAPGDAVDVTLDIAADGTVTLKDGTLNVSDNGTLNVYSPVDHNTYKVTTPAGASSVVVPNGTGDDTPYLKNHNTTGALTLKIGDVTYTYTNQSFDAITLVYIPDAMCRLAVVLSERYITDRFLPDKAIDLIDEACSDVNLKNPDLIRADEVEKEIGDYARERELLASAPPKTGDEYDEQELDRRYERIAELRSREMQLQTELDALRAKGRPELTADNLARIIELWTKIPAASIRADEFEQLAGLGDRLRAHIVGQDQAIDTVCAAIRRNRVGLQAKRKPVSFLFVGGTGVGKTELVKRLADELFHAPESLIRLDMSEYMEKFSVSRMIGSPPGYVGYDEAGQLTEKIRRRPYSVVLFDEIEKAHPDVMNLLLQILDDGRITDAQGRTVNFENTVIILTTNAGSNTRTGALGFGLSTDDQSRERAQRALNEFLRPEFLNRIDEIVYFNHLTEENFRAIAALMLDEVRAAMAERGMTLHWTPAVIDYLVRKGYSETYGARNLRRTIQRDVEDAIASAIVARRKAAGDIGIDAQDDHITVTINDREVNA